jgi:predicted alpha/beta-fold hydrolase
MAGRQLAVWHVSPYDDCAMKEFVPHKFLRNSHAMTIASHLWRRQFRSLPRGEARLFETEPGTRVLGICHWQQNLREVPTLALLHGLEGSSDSGYIMGTAEKAWVAGFNVVRLNQRNCGGGEELTPTLYHSGLSRDIRSVLIELIEKDKLPVLFAAGFSMGGNLVLKMAGEFANGAPPEVKAFVAIAPALNLAACADALAEPRNFIYEHHFVTRLKARIRHKAGLFPEKYKLNGLRKIRTVREYDDMITAPHSGFRNASDYYAQSSAGQFLAAIARPTLIVAAQDDPFVPFASIVAAVDSVNPLIELLATRCGGHCAFISASREERFWSEGRIVEFCERFIRC